MGRHRLGHVFYERDVVTVAKELLGKALCLRIGDDLIAGEIVETEAYLGVNDKAAHTYRGRRTPRNESMWGRGGLAYVYFTYGVHHCFNVVAGQVEDPVAVLIRALRPISGLDVMHQRRLSGKLRKTPLVDRDYCSGPGKLCQAFGIDRSHDGLDLIENEQLWIEPIKNADDFTIAQGARIGIDYAEEWKDRPFRFVKSGSEYLSRPI